MRVESMIIASGASLQADGLHVTGGGWQAVGGLTLPVRLRGAVAGCLLLDSSEVGQELQLLLALRTGAEGTPLGGNVFATGPTAFPSPAHRQPYVIEFDQTVLHAGLYEFVLLDSTGSQLAGYAVMVAEPVEDDISSLDGNGLDG